ncbi:hypothetical protein [Streptomyces sp. DH24]|uniref:hypothetical protein n=1 Tax=Streptomyces sp. DH24 TaxID=3040123 RepID=UPI0024425985|nr:hypothetical protein [Streptomyces sp. DH24]MDG9717492.1 hypothetical protein [Streptomyces sp. DH24]
MHRLLPPSAIAGVSVVCALGPWVFSEAAVLRGLAAAAAVTAVAGAVVMRRWDIQAGKQVADLTRARASDEWRHEERVAELETDLDESRELRGKLEQKLRAKRAELAALRNEHAALLRRYATAETERASALEGRRLLEIEAATPARALPPAPVPAQAAPPAQGNGREVADAGAGETPAVPRVFSPEGAQLFLRARAALARFDSGKSDGDTSEGPEGPDGLDPDTSEGQAAHPNGGGDDDGSPKGGGGAPKGRQAGADAGAGAAGDGTAREDAAQGKPEASDAHEHATAHSAAPRSQGAQGSGHFAVPTAVAVVPQAPVRRPSAEGGFDFFGTKQRTPARGSALDAVQNEDLADVVGQEALALHKAETEAAFKPADAESRENLQVIDLTAHDETEQIDVQDLRSAAS